MIAHQTSKHNAIFCYVKQAFLFLFCFTSAFVYSQVDIKRGFNVPDSSIRISSLYSPKTPSLLSQKNTLPAPLDLSPDQKNFMIQEKFAKPGKKIEKRLNKKDKEEGPGFKTDQYLGDFKSTSAFVSFACRDHEYVDGDRVRIYVNDSIVQYDILLDYRFKGFQIDLAEGFNKIDIEALNQGTSGPNTAEFRVYDDTGKMVSSNAWNLATGVKATLIIVKEQ